MTLHDVPASVRPSVRRLARRLALGLFLDVWPRWAAAALLAAGCVALVCRMFFPAAAPYVSWLLPAAALSLIPAIVACVRRAYRPAEVVALADALSGGHGVLLTMAERHDAAWTNGALLQRASHVALPRLRPWRRLATVLPALAFLIITMLLPQRAPAFTSAALADEIAADLTATVDALAAQDLVTPEEERRLEEAIERVRQAAQERMDASAWEAADAVREKLAASVAAKRDAAAWAQDALARYAAAVAGGADPSEASAEALAAELSGALQALAQSGLLAGAPSDLQATLRDGQLPADAEALRQLAASLAEYLGEGNGRFGELAALGRSGGRFDPSEFPLASEAAPDGDGEPGAGAANRGRADAPLTWGDESLPADRFRAETLPPGHVRSPDDWAPVVEFPGAPDAAPERSGPSAARTYADEAGSAAWRRTLAPRHQSAVKKYFQP